MTLDASTGPLDIKVVNIRSTTILVHPETSLEDRLCNIETLLTEAETFRDMAGNANTPRELIT